MKTRVRDLRCDGFSLVGEYFGMGVLSPFNGGLNEKRGWTKHPRQSSMKRKINQCESD